MKWVPVTEEPGKKILSSICLMQLQLLLCILPQALPGINALKNLNLLTLECTVWNQFAIEEEKINPFYLILLYYILVGQSPIPCFFQVTSQKKVLVKRSRAKYSPFKGKKNLWHFDVNCALQKSACLYSQESPVSSRTQAHRCQISQVQLITLHNLNSYNNRFWSTQIFTEQQHQPSYYLLYKVFLCVTVSGGNWSRALVRAGTVWPPQQDQAITQQSSGTLQGLLVKQCHLLTIK